MDLILLKFNTFGKIQAMIRQTNMPDGIKLWKK